MRKIYEQPRIDFDVVSNMDVLTESVGVDWNDEWGSDWDHYQED